MAGLVIGALATLPPFVGPDLDTSFRVEIADHLVPGLVVVAVSALVLAAMRSGRLTGTALFVAGLLVVLAGIWMTATHIPLVAQAARGEAGWGATVYHTGSAAMVLVFGLVWVTASWDDAN